MGKLAIISMEGVESLLVASNQANRNIDTKQGNVQDKEILPLKIFRFCL